MLTDKEIITKIKNGEIEYFSLIVKKYTNSIFNYIKNKIKKREDAEDLTQNVFISFYKAIERFDEEKPVKPYLYQIVKNQLKMYYRSRNQMLPLKEDIYLADYYFTDKIDKIDIEDIKSQINFLEKKEKKMLLMIADDC